MSEALARDIALLADLFKAGGWREIRVEGSGLAILLSDDVATPGLTGAAASAGAAGPGVSLPKPAPAAPAPAASPRVDAGEVDPSWVAVVAPNLGTFYRAPKPGAAPFVELGDTIAAEAEICLLEVMKLFTSVKAGVAGKLARICADDAELVEGGRILFYIDPA